MRRIAPPGRPGNDVFPQTGRLVPGPRHKAARPALSRDTSTAGNLTTTSPSVLPKVVYLRERATVRLPALPGREAELRGQPRRRGRCPAAVPRRRRRPIYMTIIASGYGELMK